MVDKISPVCYDDLINRAKGSNQMSNIHYTDSNYTFTSPTPNRKYIQYLKKIVEFNAKGINPTRREVQIAVGDPDPAAPSNWWRIEFERKPIPHRLCRSNWGNSRWAAMKQAKLIHAERDPHGNAVRYQITPNGFMLLHSVI